jgi:hypothetical protein
LIGQSYLPGRRGPDRRRFRPCQIVVFLAYIKRLSGIRARVPVRCCFTIDGAIKGAERGAALTKRMLAFARRQQLRPEAVDIAKLVDSMIEILRRSVGPAIRIATE